MANLYFNNSQTEITSVCDYIADTQTQNWNTTSYDSQGSGMANELTGYLELLPGIVGKTFYVKTALNLQPQGGLNQGLHSIQFTTGSHRVEFEPTANPSNIQLIASLPDTVSSGSIQNLVSNAFTPTEPGRLIYRTGVIIYATTPISNDNQSMTFMGTVGIGNSDTEQVICAGTMTNSITYTKINTQQP